MIDDAVANGARQAQACAELDIDARTFQRWREQGGGDDRRRGPTTTPHNKLSEAERQAILECATSPEHRDLSPRQIVPLLADAGEYIASEATFYRVLKAHELLAHRAPTRPPTHHRPRELVATAPNQVWCWDITYLRGPVAGTFFYLYLLEDLFSRAIIGWLVEAEESASHGAQLVERTATHLGVNPAGIHLHSDNGGPMKGATMLATLQRLGVVPSFSRPRVSDDNPYSESLFRTLKYRPEYPRHPFPSIDAARAWVAGFVEWYNTKHLHSGINFITPNDRLHGRDAAVLARRARVYAAAQRRHPERWTGTVRNWSRVDSVTLNPEKQNSLPD